jgi:hypothetical protein
MNQTTVLRRFLGDYLRSSIVFKTNVIKTQLIVNSERNRNRLKNIFKRLKCRIFFIYLYMSEHMDKYDRTYGQFSISIP